MGTRVGVVVPLFNGRATIGRSLASLAAQTLADWRCVVVDDGSTDDGGQTARDIARADPLGRICVVARANGGVGAARNTGLDTLLGPATGPLLPGAPQYTMLLDAGDTLHPCALADLTAAADAAGTPGALGDFDFIAATAHPEYGRTVGRHTGRFAGVGLSELLGSVYMLTHAHLIRSSLWQSVRFDPRLEVVEDTDAWFKLAEAAGTAGPVWARCPSVVASYWVGPASRSSDQPRMQLWTERVYAAAYSRCARRNGIDASPARLEGVLARSAFQHATRAAIGWGDAGLADAEAVFAPWAGTFEPDASLIARAARRAVMLTMALDPDRPEHRSRWRPRATRWLQRLANLGWAPAGATQAALDSLLQPTPTTPTEVRA